MAPWSKRGPGRIVRANGEYKRIKRCCYCYKLTGLYSAVCPECLERRKEARKRFYNSFKKRHYAS